MKIRVLLLLLAVIFGIAAVFGVMVYINNMRSKVETEGIKVDVLVANQDIAAETPVETIISKNMVEIVKIPQQYVVSAYIENLDDFNGFLTASPISKGEQITSRSFMPPEDIGFSFIIPEGMVAVTIPVNEVIGVANLINVGDKVNVIATFRPEKDTTVQEIQDQDPAEGEEGLIEQVPIYPEDSSSVDADITKTLLWAAEVLFIGIRDRSNSNEQDVAVASGVKEASEERTVTLALTSEQAEKLVFSEEFGSVWLALLPLDADVSGIDTEGRTYDNIFD